jgi:hypothetical protein
MGERRPIEIEACAGTGNLAGGGKRTELRRDVARH